MRPVDKKPSGLSLARAYKRSDGQLGWNGPCQFPDLPLSDELALYRDLLFCDPDLTAGDQAGARPLGMRP